MNGKQMRQFFCSFVLLVVLFCLTANAAEPLRVLIDSCANNYKWHKTDKSVALTNNGKAVWQFNYGNETAKPFFHPLSLLDGTVLTVDRPADHFWHHGLWFSWKFINGVNFWEENPKTAKSDGLTLWDNVKVDTREDFSVRISMNLKYLIKSEMPLLSEKREVKVHSPEENGCYIIDWRSTFRACSDKDVKIDRTPLVGEPGGKSYGGYAGLSVRLNNKGKYLEAATEKKAIAIEEATVRLKSGAMDFSSVYGDKSGGISVLDHPENLNSPTPWYAAGGKVMKYFSPAVICYKPLTLKPGQSFTLNYRIIVHAGRWNSQILETEIKKYKRYIANVKDKKDD